MPLSQKSYEKFKKKVCTPENELKAKFGGKYELVSPHKREFHPQDWKYWKESNQLVKWKDFIVVWTDGSLSEGRAGSGVYWSNYVYKFFRTIGEQEVLQAELEAIEVALLETPLNENLLIILDSKVARDCIHKWRNSDMGTRVTMPSKDVLF